MLKDYLLQCSTKKRKQTIMSGIYKDNKDRLDQLKGQVLLPLDGERKVVRLKASDAEAYMWFKHIKVTLKLGK